MWCKRCDYDDDWCLMIRRACDENDVQMILISSSCLWWWEGSLECSMNHPRLGIGNVSPYWNCWELQTSPLKIQFSRWGWLQQTNEKVTFCQKICRLRRRVKEINVLKIIRSCRTTVYVYIAGMVWLVYDSIHVAQGHDGVCSRWFCTSGEKRFEITVHLRRIAAIGPLSWIFILSFDPLTK